MGAWRYRAWATHAPESDQIEVRITRCSKNVDVTESGRRIVTYEHEYAWYDRPTEGWDWRAYTEGSTIPPFLTITGEQFLTIDPDEGEELLSYLLPYRIDCELSRRRDEDFLPV